MPAIVNNERAILTLPSKTYRGSVAYGITPRVGDAVEPGGGHYKAGLIRGVSVLSRGEAATHEQWVDRTMLDQVSDAINQRTTSGTKSRFTHPGLSGDGLGKGLGRMFESWIDDDVVRSDLHLFESAHKTPDGDLAGYVLGLAKESPESFGMSIAFDPDIGEMDRFVAENEDEDGRFESPDPDNSNNYPHARVADLSAVDAVDDPAANPDGLFHRGDELAMDADAALDYIFSRCVERPESELWGIHLDRVRDYVTQWMTNKGLELQKPHPLNNWKPAAQKRARELELCRQALVANVRRI